LKEDIHVIVQEIKENRNYLAHNEILFNIFEGELLPYVEEDLKKQLSEKSFETMRYRISPINLLKKLIDKLSAIYQQPVTRIVEPSNDTDKELLNWYEEQFDVNKIMNNTNEFFNLFKSTLLQPYLNSDGLPRLRAIPSHCFWVRSTDPIEPTRPTEAVLFMGKKDDKKIFYFYDKDEIVIADEDGDVQSDLMGVYGLDGSNPIGRLPFVYINRSINLLHPKLEADLLKLTKLCSVLVSDLNYVSMFQAFSILYGINVEDKGLVFAPNAFWNFSQLDPSLKPELGTLKNQADISALIELIQFELSLWLNSRGLRPGAIGQLDAANASASGISKLIDEIDTTEERQRQVSYFQTAEKELWDLTMHHLHPVWVKKGSFENRAIFSTTAQVVTIFAEQVPLQQRGDLVEDLDKEIKAGFTSRKRAIKKLNPHMSDEEIDELIKEIDEENIVEIDPEDSDSFEVEEVEKEDENNG